MMIKKIKFKLLNRVNVCIGALLAFIAVGTTSCRYNHICMYGPAPVDVDTMSEAMYGVPSPEFIQYDNENQTEQIDQNNNQNDEKATE